MVSNAFPIVLHESEHHLGAAEREWSGMKNTPEYHNVKRLDECVSFLFLGSFDLERLDLVAPQIVLTPGVNNAICLLLLLISLASCSFMTLTRE
jgi:hypothetical protein